MYDGIMDEKKFEDLVYRALTKFYQNVLLPKFATKEDLVGFATKEDLKKGMEKLDHRMEKLEGKMESVEAKVSSLERAVWNVSDHQGKKLDLHEKRITSLEENMATSV